MITKEHIDAMEERCRRMFPYIDTIAVNVILAEIQSLRKLMDSPTPQDTKEVKLAEVPQIEEVLIVVEKPVKAKKNKVEPAEKLEESTPQSSTE